MSTNTQNGDMTGQPVPKNTGLAHDDEGHVDDKRVAGWIFVALSVGVGLFGILNESEVAVEMTKIFIWPGTVALGITAFDGLGKKLGGGS